MQTDPRHNFQALWHCRIIVVLLISDPPPPLPHTHKDVASQVASKENTGGQDDDGEGNSPLHLGRLIATLGGILEHCELLIQ